MQEQEIVVDERTALKKLKYFFLYWFVRTMLTVSNYVPRTWWLAFCGWLGRVAFLLLPKFKKVAVIHLGLAYRQEKSAKEIYKLAKQVFIMVGKNAGDTFRSINVKSLANLQEFLITTGMENFETANAKNKGVIFLTCHM